MTTPDLSDRLSVCDAWVHDHRAELEERGRAAKVKWQTVGMVLHRLVLSVKPTGTTDLTAAQIAHRAFCEERQAQRALRVLTDMGVLVLVTRGKSPGRNGGPGRGAVRRIDLPLPAVDNPNENVNDRPLDVNDRPPEGHPLRVISPEPPRGKSETGVRAGGGRQGGRRTEPVNDLPHGAGPDRLVAEVARRLVGLEHPGTVKDPTGLARHKEKLVADTLRDLRGSATAWPGWLAHGHHTDLLQAVTSRCRGEPVSLTIAIALDAAVARSGQVEPRPA